MKRAGVNDLPVSPPPDEPPRPSVERVGPPGIGGHREAWRRATQRESRWPAAVATAVAIGLQVVLPAELNLSSRYLLPGVEAVLLVALALINPGRVSRREVPLRWVGLTLIAVASVANAYSAIRLVLGLVRGTEGGSPGPLLATGSAIYITNIVVFALWYWEFDRGGPAARAHGLDPYPDLMFPQMATPGMADNDWEPEFMDYLYVSFTNATAFSPTDTMPLTRGAKLAMLVQSAVALVTVALVIARSVNILK